MGGKRILYALILLALLEAVQPLNAAVYAGFRSSPYGYQTQQSPGWWANITKQMSSKVSSSTPSIIWILGEIMTPDQPKVCKLYFPSPGGTYQNIIFNSNDVAESYLSTFDANGIKVWLQVEPGDANIIQLIDLVMGRYKNHPSVIGFGVDLEWFYYSNYNNEDSPGRPVTDAEAQAWLNEVKKYNSSYKLFLKHWITSKMPPTFRNADLIFVDDSEDNGNLQGMINEFKSWGNAFSSSNVGFQFGYPSDKGWWSSMSDPEGQIANMLIGNISNTKGVYWVDFSITDILCADNTLYGSCSTTKPKYCSSGTLINACRTCGCSTGTCQSDGTCKTTTQTCTDGTPYGSCSSAKPKYCNNSGTLLNNYCYGLDKIVGTADDCGCSSGTCQSNGTCSVCGNGKCETGENYSNCPKDCCKSSCTATSDSVCHSECNNYASCSGFQSLCNTKALGTKVCTNSTYYATCCNGTATSCGTKTKSCPTTSYCNGNQVCIYPANASCSNNCSGGNCANCTPTCVPTCTTCGTGLVCNPNYGKCMQPCGGKYTPCPVAEVPGTPTSGGQTVVYILLVLGLVGGYLALRSVSRAGVSRRRKR